jgi:hypothetical protein
MNEAADEGDPSLASLENVDAVLSIRIAMELTNKILQKKSKLRRRGRSGKAPLTLDDLDFSLVAPMLLWRWPNSLECFNHAGLAAPRPVSESSI